MATDEHAVVTLEHDGDVAVIRVDDGKANAISHAVVEGIDRALQRARTESKAVVLVGREGRFSAGFHLPTMQSGLTEARGLLEAGARLALSLYTSPVPVVIGCTGHALAMGGILLFCGDLRIGADGPFKIGLNEVAIGMAVPRFAVELAQDRLSPRHLGRALQLATIYDPPGAVDAGFLDEVVPLAEVAAVAVARATALAAALDPAAFRLTRQHLRGARAARLVQQLQADTSGFTTAAS